MKTSLLLAAMLLFSAPCLASQYSRPETMPCWKVKSYILLFGKEAALAWAEARFDAARIEEVKKRCKL